MLGAILVCAGCQAVPMPQQIFMTGLASGASKTTPKKIAPAAPPVKMAAIWSPAVLNRPGESPLRGFGGRLYFYDAENRPVPVEGQLVVYAYDDSNPYSDGKTPDRKFVFTPEQFARHHSPTELGDSYSIWLPWDPVGHPQVEVSLVPILTTSSGQLVMGSSSRALLPGPKTPPTVSRIEHSQLPPPHIRYETGGPGPHAVQPAAYQAEIAGGMGTAVPSGSSPASKPNGGVDALTIPLPGTLADRLAQAGPQQVNPLQQLAMKRAVAAPHAGAGGPGVSLPPAGFVGSGQNVAGVLPPLMPHPGTAGMGQGTPPSMPGLLSASPLPGGLTTGPSRVPLLPNTAPGGHAATLPARPPGLVPQDAP